MHDLFTSLWIGGLVFMVVILIPTIRKFFEEKEQGELFLSKIQRRLKIVVIISMLGLMITGILMSKQAITKGILEGPFVFDFNTYSTLLAIKHLLMILMVIVAIVKGAILDNLKKQSKAIKKARILLIVGNLAFGIAILILSGITAAIASMPVMP